MISAMAREDAANFESEGIKLSFDEIIRLNALGLKAERNSDATADRLRRVAFLNDDIIFHELTIGHQLWIEEVSKVLKDNHLSSLLFVAYCSATEVDKLPYSTDVKTIKKELRKFTKKLRKFTKEEVDDALDYVIRGANQLDGEEVEREQVDKDKNSNINTIVGLICYGVALKVGTKKEVEKLTQSELHLISKYSAEMLSKTKAKDNSYIGDYLLYKDILTKKYSTEKVSQNQ